MAIQMNLSSLCTCGSNLPVNDCCFKTINTTPKGPKTNYSHPRCYASALCDCSRTISKEHFLSKSVMELWGKAGIFKAPFIEGDGKNLKVSSLSAKILCERHNNALSSLDEVAKKFFEFALLRTEHCELIMRGTDLERWMLKVMCGHIATGYAQTEGGELIPAFPPPLPALQTLFGELELPESWGLVIPESHGIPLPNLMAISTFAYGKDDVMGCEVRINYIRVLFFLIDIKAMQKELKNATHRPSCFLFTLDGISREIHLGWPEGSLVIINFNSNKTIPSKPMIRF